MNDTKLSTEEKKTAAEAAAMSKAIAAVPDSVQAQIAIDFVADPANRCFTLPETVEFDTETRGTKFVVTYRVDAAEFDAEALVKHYIQPEMGRKVLQKIRTEWKKTGATGTAEWLAIVDTKKFATDMSDWVGLQKGRRGKRELSEAELIQQSTAKLSIEQMQAMLAEKMAEMEAAK